MCGKFASFGRYHDNSTPTMEKLPKYNIVKNNSLISICYEKKYFIHLELLLLSLLYRQSKDTVKNTNFRTFRGIKKGVKSHFFILKLILGHEPDMVYPPPPQVCFCRPCFS